jgi:hypothetical protein
MPSQQRPKEGTAGRSTESRLEAFSRENGFYRSRFDPTFVEQRDMRCVSQREANVVRDQQDRAPVFLVQAPQSFEQGVLGGRIQTGRRFVENQNFGLANQRPSDQTALSLPAG